MPTLQSLIGNSLEYNLTWSVYGRHEPYKCDWRIDPCLVVIYSPEVPCEFIVQKDGRIESFNGQAGDVFLIPAGTTHKFDSPTCVIGGVCVHYTLFSSVDVLDLYRVPKIVSGESAADIGRTVYKLVEIVGQKPNPEAFSDNDNLDFVEIAREREIVFQLLAKVLHLSELRPRGKERLFILQKLRGSLRYLEENLEQKTGVEELGEIAGLSAHRFSALFREVMGNSPHQYILRRRIEKAMALLTSGDAPVMEIAGQLGFHDQPHFTKLFKSTTGVSPTFYRKNFRRRFSAPANV
jgi:AraC-like DNA-binding protein